MMETAPATLIVVTNYSWFPKSQFGEQDWDSPLRAGLGTNIDHHHCKEMMVLHPTTWIFFGKAFSPLISVSSTFILVRKSAFSANSTSRNIFQWLS